jgi:hypothetical protein
VFLMPSMRDFSPPNYALFQSDGLPYWHGTFSHTNCSTCSTRNSTQLLTDEHWDGIFRVHIDPGNTSPRTDDFMTCDWKPGTGTGVAGGGAVVASNAVFRQTTSLARSGTSQWAINVYCDDAACPGENLLIWRGLQRKSPSTIGLSGPAGWYDYDDGCDTSVTEMELVRKSRDPCECPQSPVYGCLTGDTSEVENTTLGLSSFNISDWKVPFTSSCWNLSASPLKCRCGGCNAATSSMDYWDGTIPWRGASSICDWGLDADQTDSSSKRIQSLGSGASFSNCGTCGYGDGWTQMIAISVHFNTGNFWVCKAVCRTTAGGAPGPTCGDTWLGVWYKENGETPEGFYVRADQDSWNLLCPGSPGSSCCSCDDQYCETGPDNFTLEYV